MVVEFDPLPVKPASKVRLHSTPHIPCQQVTPSNSNNNSNNGRERGGEDLLELMDLEIVFFQPLELERRRNKVFFSIVVVLIVLCVLCLFILLKKMHIK